MAATLSDVSRRAGVSPATASRVLNGERYVSSASRMRVEAAARELGYVPNPAARDLSRARTSTIAFLVHHGQYPACDEGTFGARVLLGAAGAVAELGYDLLYSVIPDGDVDRLASLPVTHAGRAGGVVLLGPAFPQAAVAGLVGTGRPLVLVDNLLPGADAVMADNRAGAEALTRHLIDQHRFRRIACLAGPPDWPSTRERVDGYRHAMTDAGLVPRVVHNDQTTAADGAAGYDRLAGEPPEAVLAINDAMAVGALHRARTTDASPRPAIVGFDDSSWAAVSDPPITTVAIDAHAMGAAAATHLIERLERAHRAGGDHRPTPTSPTLIRVPTRLRLRRSCGCAGTDVQV